MRRLVGLALVLIGLTAFIASALGWLASWAWWLELFGHFRPTYLVLLLAAAAGGLLMRRPWIVAVFALAAGTNLVPLAPFLVPRSAVAARDQLTIVHFNVLTSNRRKADALRWVSGTGADLVILQEIDHDWVARIEHDLPGYRIHAALPRRDNFGLAFLVAADSPVRMESGVTIADGVRDAGGVPALQTRLSFGGKTVRLLSMHTLPPVNARNAERRDAMLHAAAAWVRAGGEPAIVLGDLNVTPWSPAFRRFEKESALRNTARGRGIGLTWPAFGPLQVLAIPIDHVLVDRELGTVERTIGPALGSDHRPVLVRLTWNEDSI